MISVMIVEDELNILNYMKTMIESFRSFQVKAVFSDPEEALDQFENFCPDCVFLDVEMPGLNGIDLAKAFLKKREELDIVFTTAYSQYALKAFEVEAVDYLMKPVLRKDLERTVKRLEKSRKRITGREPFQDGESLFPIKCFGCFEVRGGDGALMKWPTKKTEEVFAYFICYQGESISKWKLIDLFWPEMPEEAALHNLYNTIYRIKNVLAKLPVSACIRKLNDGYVLEADTVLSDLKKLVSLTGPNQVESNLAETDLLFSTYQVPIFGARDYLWSLPIQEYLNDLSSRICIRLIDCYHLKDDWNTAEKAIRHYVSNHPENEEMMVRWLILANTWKGESKAQEYKIWFNRLLEEADLPTIR